MLKKLLPLLLCLCLGLTACGPRESSGEPDDSLTVAATTYPVYLFAREVTKGVRDIEVTLMVNQSVSCLHDYTLSVHDMKVLEEADVVILNGAGLELSMENALAASRTRQIDCSQGIQLLASSHSHDHDHDHSHETQEADHDHETEDTVCTEDHDHETEDAVCTEDHDHETEDAVCTEDHDHETEDAACTDAHTPGDLHPLEGEPDGHIWMDPQRACQMLHNLAHGLAEIDPANAALYEANARAAAEKVSAAYEDLAHRLDGLDCRELITFHDGFSYFAEAFGLTILRSIEEEAGSEASARDVMEILEEMEYHHVPAIFTETNGSTATAQVIQRENGTPFFPLDMLMSGPTEEADIDTYIHRITANVMTIQEAYT